MFRIPNINQYVKNFLRLRKVENQSHKGLFIGFVNK